MTITRKKYMFRHLLAIVRLSSSKLMVLLYIYIYIFLLYTHTHTHTHTHIYIYIYIQCLSCLQPEHTTAFPVQKLHVMQNVRVYRSLHHVRAQYRGCQKLYTHFKRYYLCITFRSGIKLRWQCVIGLSLKRVRYSNECQRHHETGRTVKEYG